MSDKNDHGKDDYILIDTGYCRKRKELDKVLTKEGVDPENLKLVILTHQDFDHSGNCVYLSDNYHSKIAMHMEDSEAVQRGDMLWYRKRRNIFTRVILKILLIVFRIGKFEKFTPDLFLDEGDDLSSYGFDAQVLHLPCQSKGSIGVLTSNGNLFCGDLFMNFKKPDKPTLIDSKEQLNASIEKVSQCNPNIIFPGHGKPFTFDHFEKRE